MHLSIIRSMTTLHTFHHELTDMKVKVNVSYCILMADLAKAKVVRQKLQLSVVLSVVCVCVCATNNNGDKILLFLILYVPVVR